MWEFRYTAGGPTCSGQPRLRGGEPGYALDFQTREANWASSQALYEQFQLAFRPG